MPVPTKSKSHVQGLTNKKYDPSILCFKPVVMLFYSLSYMLFEGWRFFLCQGFSLYPCARRGVLGKFAMLRFERWGLLKFLLALVVRPLTLAISKRTVFTFKLLHPLTIKALYLFKLLFILAFKSCYSCFGLLSFRVPSACLG